MQICISKVATLGALAGVGLVMSCFCLSFCVSSCDLFQFESCSCILAMLMFCCLFLIFFFTLWVLCQYNFQNARQLMFLRHRRIAELCKASKNGFRHASVLSRVLFAARCNLSIPIGYGWAVANTTELILQTFRSVNRRF